MQLQNMNINILIDSIYQGHIDNLGIRNKWSNGL